MSQKYAALIEMHNQAIDILEKRNMAIQRLQKAENALEISNNRDKSIKGTRHWIETTNYRQHAVNVQKRYISLLTRAYGRLAASVCGSIAEDVPIKSMNIDISANTTIEWVANAITEYDEKSPI